MFAQPVKELCAREAEVGLLALHIPAGGPSARHPFWAALGVGTVCHALGRKQLAHFVPGCLLGLLVTR